MGRVPRDKFYYLDLTTTFSQLLRDSPSRTTTRGSLGRGTARVSLKIRRAEDESGSAARGGEDKKARRAAHESSKLLDLATGTSGTLGASASDTNHGHPSVSTVSLHLTPPYFMLRAITAASPRTPRPGREFGAVRGLGSARGRGGEATRRRSGAPRGSSASCPNTPPTTRRPTGCDTERPCCLSVRLKTSPLFSHARATGGGPRRSPRLCFCYIYAAERGVRVRSPFPHPECGLQDTGIGIGLEGSRLTSSLTGSGKDGHCTYHDNGRENARTDTHSLQACIIGFRRVYLVFLI